MKRTWDKYSIQKLLDKNFKACRRALIVLYQRQTQDEQQSKQTKHNNNRGFNHADGKFGTLMAQKVMKGGLFEPKDVLRTRKMLKKYSGQLAEIANAKQQKQAA